MSDLTLDPAIRDWVLIPIVAVMFAVGVLRHFASGLTRSATQTDVKQIMER